MVLIEVTTLGMDSLYEKNSEVFDSVRLINCAHDLLQKHQKSSRIREELENRKHRTEVDIQNLQLSHTKLKAAIEQNERSLRQQQEKERQLLNKNKLLVGRLKMEKEEVKKLQSVIQHRDAQFKHEIKKKERELIKLKDRIHLLLTDKTEKRLGLEIANPLPRSDGKRGTWKTGNKQEEEMYRSVISNYEDKQKELMVENTELRQCLRDMQRELVGLLNTPDSSIGVSMSNSTPEIRDLSEMTEEEDISEADALSEAHFEMPYEFVRGDIEKSLKEKYKQLKDYIRNIESQKGVLMSAESIPQPPEMTITQVPPKPKQAPPTQAPPTPVSPAKEDQYKLELEKSKKQIERYRDIIEQQEKLLQNQLDMGSEQDDARDQSILQTSELYEEKERLETDRKFFQEQRANFDEERKKFTEAAIKLAQERKEFEAERTAFLQEQFLQITPFREANKTESKTSHQDDPIPFSISDNKKTEEKIISNELKEKEKKLPQKEMTLDKEKTDSEAEKVTKDTQTVGSLSPVYSSDAGQSPVLGSQSKGTSLEDIRDTQGQSQGQSSRKPRSKRLLPATPMSTPAPTTPSQSAASINNGSSGTNSPAQQQQYPPSSAIPKVMARPHSSIAIADGQNSDSTQSIPSHAPPTFAPRTLRPRSSAPSTAELYKKLGLEPPKDRVHRDRIKGGRHSDAAFHSTSRDTKVVSHDNDREYHDNQGERYRERSYTENSASSGSRDRSELTSSSQEFADKENLRERSRDSRYGTKESSRERYQRDDRYIDDQRSYSSNSRERGDTPVRERSRDRYEKKEKSYYDSSHQRSSESLHHDRVGGDSGIKEPHRDRYERQDRDRDRGDRYYDRQPSHDTSWDRSMEEAEWRPSSRREKSKDRERDRDRSWERRRDRSHDDTAWQPSARPNTARERRSSLERSRSVRERPKSSKEDNYVDSDSRRKSLSSKDLDRQHERNPRYSLGGREASFDYSSHSRERSSREDYESSRERRESPSREVKRSHSSAGYPWRRSSGSYVASPLVLRNPEQTHTRSSSRK